MMEVVAVTMLFGGLAFVLVGVVGVLRLPDFYSRLHATSKCDTLGLALMVSGVAIHTGLTLTTVKVLLVVVLVGVLNATGVHAIGRAAYRSGLPPWVAGRERRP